MSIARFARRDEDDAVLGVELFRHSGHLIITVEDEDGEAFIGLDAEQAWDLLQFLQSNLRPPAE